MIAYANKADTVIANRIYIMRDMQIYKHPRLIGESYLLSMDEALIWRSGQRFFDN